MNSTGRRTRASTMRLPKNSWLRKNDDVAMAKAKLATARNGPLMRKAGMPMATDATAPTSPATNSVRKKSRPSDESLAAVAAPKPNSAI